eukprot:CAMPEP_0206220584 /NCGR_PEP_ID=MMETSP0047_2-20121206/4958_1 /ASSEMBLY_ACC=CAM_ASM_000192 /TAXON_ID=195065 /ORGANISM="Chroomonas mesostigmatica_cf, Strain CCMP1168" /LENGTH=618 /DNA_ID=CAMNT_0053643259 /DNA_START=184 /DNA_END=2040 /DNA_ORIENTATION=+
MTSSGLATVSMLDVHPNAFGMVFILMFIGCNLVIQLAVLIFRKIKYRLLRKRLVQYMHAVFDTSRRTNAPIASAEELQRMLERKDLEDRAVGVVVVAIVLHMALFIGVATFILYAIDSSLYPFEVEVQARGFSRLWNCAVMVMTSFSNCGITLSSINMMDYVYRPGVYLFLCIMILAGNTCAPMCLRGIIRVMHTCAWALRLDTSSLTHVLERPRSVAYLLFDSRQTLILFLINVVFNVVEYVFFLGSTMKRDEIQPVFANQATIPGIGFFQTISTRNAGLQILDLRLLNRGMLVVYIVFMYISSAPIVRTMYVSERTERLQNRSDNLQSHLTRKTTVAVIMDFQKNFLFTHSAWILFFYLTLAFSEDEGVTKSGGSNENLFDVFFEVISAYGNVGISMGYPGAAYSLSGAFSTLGKFVIMMVMIMGKVRGLPTNSDMVVDFSFEALYVALLKAEEESGLTSGLTPSSIESRHASMDLVDDSTRSRLRNTHAIRSQQDGLPVLHKTLSRLSAEISRTSSFRMKLSEAVFHPPVAMYQPIVSDIHSSSDLNRQPSAVSAALASSLISPPAPPPLQNGHHLEKQQVSTFEHIIITGLQIDPGTPKANPHKANVWICEETT